MFCFLNTIILILNKTQENTITSQAVSADVWSNSNCQ